MAKNIFTDNPVWGDAVVGNLITRVPEFITSESFDMDALPSGTYERIGFVGGRYGRQVLICYYKQASKKWCDRISYKLTGYKLDGAEHTGVLSIRENGSANESVDYTVTYTASDKAGLVTALNAYFAATEIFASQRWNAYTDDAGDVWLQCDYNFWQQYSYNVGKSGFTLSVNVMPDVQYDSRMLRRNGVGSGEGSILNMPRALAYYRNDNSSTAYNPATDITSVKTTYPICLPGYLGTSQYQSDHCKFLRGVYGEGEEGWIKYMKAQEAVPQTDWGVMGLDDAKERTALLASKHYSYGGNVYALCPAAQTAITLPQSEIITDWHLPSARHLLDILHDVQYGTSAARDADAANRVLWRMGGDPVANNRYFWSAIRFNGYNAWYANGLTGCFFSYGMCYLLWVLPVSLYRLPQAII